LRIITYVRLTDYRNDDDDDEYDNDNDNVLITDLLVTYSPSLHDDSDFVTAVISRKATNTLYVFILYC